MILTVLKRETKIFEILDPTLLQYLNFDLQKNPAALNALGWYAMNMDRNYSMAASYFEESYRYGNPDAANHLGFLHLHGYYPNKSADPVRVKTFLTRLSPFRPIFFIDHQHSLLF